jgi:hypothetical protein
MKDLVFLVADKDMQFALNGGIKRHEALNIRQITFDFLPHPQHDPGVRTTGVSMLNLVKNKYSHALLILDFEGSGTDHSSATALEEELDHELSLNWSNNAKAIVIDPELEVWMWGSDNAMEVHIGRPDQSGIRPWLKTKGFQFNANEKPLRPKEALDLVLKNNHRPHSSAIFDLIASNISLQNCKEKSFLRLKKQLQTWFPIQTP